jgi:hypothetical protein
LRSEEDAVVELLGGGNADMDELDVDVPFEQFSRQLKSTQANTDRMAYSGAAPPTF